MAAPVRTHRYFRADFDRRNDFVALRDFLFNGKAITTGDVLDKRNFTDRRLRQLYDRRMIDILQKPVEPTPMPPPSQPRQRVRLSANTE